MPTLCNKTENNKVATKRDIEKLEKRFIKMSGFHNKLKSMSKFIEITDNNMRLIRNEFKRVDKRIDKLESKIKTLYRNRKIKYEDK